MIATQLANERRDYAAEAWHRGSVLTTPGPRMLTPSVVVVLVVGLFVGPVGLVGLVGLGALVVLVVLVGAVRRVGPGNLRVRALALPVLAGVVGALLELG